MSILETSSSEQLPFFVSSHRIEIFGLKAWWERQYWVIGVPFGGTYVLTQIDPAPVFDDIAAIIRQKRAQGREATIDHILITNRVAACLFLEHKLLSSHFASAQVENEGIIISLFIEGKARPVKIISERNAAVKAAIAARDATGNII